MPWKTKKVKGGYKVVNLNTGKTYSKRPQTKARADAQRKALYANWDGE